MEESLRVKPLLPMLPTLLFLLTCLVSPQLASASDQPQASPPFATADSAPGQTPVSTHLPADDGNLVHYFERHALALPDPQLSYHLPVELAQRVFFDGGYLLTAPGRWDQGDVVRFSLLAAVAGGAFGADRQVDIESRVRHPRSSQEGHVENAIQNFGVANGIAPVLGGVLAVGLFEQYFV